MFKRIITGAVGLVFFTIVVFFSHSLMLNIAVSILSVLAIYEVFIPTKYVSSPALLVISMAFSAVMPFLKADLVGKSVMIVYVLVLLIVMLFSKKKISLEQIGLVFMMTTLLSLAFCSMIYLRDIAYDDIDRFAPEDGLFLLVMAAIGSWGTDAGAYFTGYLFGKHKLAPEISPKKTVEGAIGGVVTCVLLFVIYGLVYDTCFLKDQGTVSLGVLALLALVCSVVSMVGDLSASYIKRACNIKDFGHIMPGHGGILDRFDSMLLVAPVIYIAVQILPILTR